MGLSIPRSYKFAGDRASRSWSCAVFGHSFIILQGREGVNLPPANKDYR